MASDTGALQTSKGPVERRSLPALIEREHQRQRRRRALWLSALLAVPLAAGAIAWATRPRPVPLADRFRVAPLTRGDLVRVVRATGHVEALTSVSVGAEVSGRIASVEVDFNDRVVAGQVLARFDRAALDAQRLQIEATVAAARAAVTQAKLDLEQARRTLARSDVLFAQHVQTAAEHEAARSLASLSEARLAGAQAQLAAQEAARALARTNLDHAVVKSPIDGVIITRNVDPGQTVASMLQTPVLFTVAADLERMRVVTAVDEADIGEVAAGQSATFTVSAYPERTFEGVVTEVRNSPTIVQDVVTYGAVVEVQNKDLLLKPGMTASVKIRTAQAKDVTRAPTVALRFVLPGSERPEGEGLWVLSGGQVSLVPVTVGISDGELTAVTGAAPGTQVVTELSPAGRKAYGLDHRP